MSYTARVSRVLVLFIVHCFYCDGRGVHLVSHNKKIAYMLQSPQKVRIQKLHRRTLTTAEHEECPRLLNHKTHTHIHDLQVAKGQS